MRVIIPVLLAMFAITPAMAAATCDTGNSGVHVSFGVRIGKHFSKDELERFDAMELRQRGIDFESVERMGDGCLQVIKRDADGHRYNTYYDPETYRELD